MAVQESQAGSCRIVEIGLGHQAPNGLARTLTRAGWTDVTFAFHDGEEIGPRMLARVAKHTGLKPEDL